MTKNDTVRVFIPLKLQRRNGRPKIVAPKVEAYAPTGIQDPHILKALGRAWSWRRKLESGEFATIQDIARAEKVTDRFISRIMQLAYLSPDVIDELVMSRTKPAVKLNDLIYFSSMPWRFQKQSAFDEFPKKGAFDSVREDRNIITVDERFDHFVGDRDGIERGLQTRGRG